ncbi:hypothetical protein Pla52o_39780 [Novipirellula galeiformis]|uniref:Uncharacterized protein n=1 Tax=Novipirellula galeiformis TaxID=2528004 RepID=A0A5C6CC13_9BACT|nr:hypothetical protein [Novipirellula galeiformis]TWU20946.1 hypothetical protein Pla52o_39780 [Novipirellula galeiformis]
MSATNRAALITKLYAALKKHYKPTPQQPTRPLLEHILYASLLQDCSAELADEGMAKCEQDFFDWNEVRVTTVSELSQVLSRLPDATKAATRLKANLQAVFEEFYTFDLDHLKKENLGKAVAKFEKMPGMTPFVLSYTIQHGLGGHSIPVDYSAMVVLMVTDIASQAEAAAGKVPGLERAIPKSKGIEFSDLLHQAAVALNNNAKDKKSRALVDDVAKGSSKRLDEWQTGLKAAKIRVANRKAAAAHAAEEEGDEEAAEAVAVTKKSADKKTTEPAAKPKKSSKAAEVVAEPAKTKKSTSKKKIVSKPAEAAAEPRSETKKKATGKDSKEKSTKKSASNVDEKASAPKKSASRKLTKRKPR